MQWYSGALLWREVLSVAQARVAPLSAIQQRRGKVEWGEPAIQGEKQGTVLQKGSFVCGRPVNPDV